MAQESAVLHRDLHQSPYHAREASGLYISLSDGRQIIDASGGAAVSCIGHGNPRVKQVIASQIAKLDYCATLFFSCDATETLSRKLIDSTNGQMAHVFIVNSGSEAMDAAMKLARQYFLEMPTPEPSRIRFIARQGSYHGNTLGALGMSGHLGRRSIYEPMLSPLVTHVSACNAYRGMRDGETEQMYVARLAKELDTEFQRVAPDTVCAFVAEPVVGAALGCVPCVPGYFKAMKAVCDKYGALLILDEVMCGMGRSGTMHAWQQEEVVPDIQTIGKGLGGGYVPIAGLLVGHRVSKALKTGTGQFVHAQTYQAHPMVCAAALEVQRIIDEDKLIENAHDSGILLESRLKEAFKDSRWVGNIRGKGLFWALEIVQDRQSKAPFDPSLGVAMAIHQTGLAQEPGVMIYPGTGSANGKAGDHVIIAPPYNVTNSQIDQIVFAAEKAVSSAMSKITHAQALFSPRL